MIFGRKRKLDATDTVESEEAQEVVDSGDESDELLAEETSPEEPVESPDGADDEEGGSEEDRDSEEDGDEDEPVDQDEAEQVDWRADGPFDIEEVDLHDDKVTRLDLGSLVITPWEGIGLQLQVNEATRAVQAVTAVWKDSGLEVALFAAPSNGSLATELREDLAEEAEQAGGSATQAEGPFGTEVRRVLPQEGPGGEQLFHVSRIWFAEGPRWLLRGTLLGEAAIGDPDAPLVAPFVEFFRNLVVRRGGAPMVPGELIAMTMPESAGEG